MRRAKMSFSHGRMAKPTTELPALSRFPELTLSRDDDKIG
jgi:hypothetical protein